MPTIQCTFRPQAWISDHAIEVDADRLARWTMNVDVLPEPNSYASDELRYAPEAPAWAREWSGPFEVDYELVDA